MNTKEFNMDSFLNVEIPVMLHQVESYCVKGGRAFDILFKEKTYSLNWDIITTKENISFFENWLETYANDNGLRLIIMETQPDVTIRGEKIQYGFEDYFYSDNKDPFFLNLLITDNFDRNIITINEIKYISLNDFLANKYEKPKTTNKYSEIIVTMNNELEINLNTQIIDPLEIINLSLLEYKNKLRSKVRDIFGNESVYVYGLYEDTFFNPFLLVFNKYKSGLISLQDFLEEIDSIDYDGINENIKNYFDSDNIVDRLDHYSNIPTIYIENIKVLLLRDSSHFENITWDDLSDDFKQYLMTECDKQNDKLLTIFSINETCKAVLRCKDNFNIEISKKGCISDQD